MYRIRAGQSQWVLTRATLESVIRVAHKLAERYPTGQTFQIYLGERLVATTSKLELYSDMGRKPAPKPDDPAQSKRFIDTAVEVGADGDNDALKRAFEKIIRSPNRPDRETDTKTTSPHKSR